MAIVYVCEIQFCNKSCCVIIPELYLEYSARTFERYLNFVADLVSTDSQNKPEGYWKFCSSFLVYICNLWEQRCVLNILNFEYLCNVQLKEKMKCLGWHKAKLTNINQKRQDRSKFPTSYSKPQTFLPSKPERKIHCWRYPKLGWTWVYQCHSISGVPEKAVKVLLFCACC